MRHSKNWTCLQLGGSSRRQQHFSLKLFQDPLSLCKTFPLLLQKVWTVCKMVRYWGDQLFQFLVGMSHSGLMKETSCSDFTPGQFSTWTLLSHLCCCNNDVCCLTLSCWNMQCCFDGSIFCSKTWGSLNPLNCAPETRESCWKILQVIYIFSRLKMDFYSCLEIC